MPVRHTNLGSTIGSLIAGVLLFTIDRQYLTSAQETKRSPEVAKTSAQEKLIARGKYIVEGLAGCGYCHTPRDENGEIDPHEVARRRPGLAAYHLGATPR